MEQSPKKLHVLLIYVVLVLATFIAFEHVRRNDFISFDDGVYVTENPQVKRGITRESVVWAFTASHAGYWHPLTWLSHMLDCELFGLNPCWHHLTSLLFHIINTLLLFGILKKMTGAVWRSAFVTAAFALHPLHVESVAWVAERKDVLSGFFWMLTMAAYIRYTRRPGIGRYLLVALAFSLGLMAKPMLVTLPFVLLLLDYWPLGRFSLDKQGAKKASPQIESATVGCYGTSAYHLIMEKIPLFVLVVISSVVTYMVQQGKGAMVPAESLPLIIRIANALVSYTSYIDKMIYPSRLAVLYPHMSSNLPTWQAILSTFILACILLFVIYSARRYPYLAVGWLWYLGTLIPAIGLVQVGNQAMADRFTYLPSIGIFIMVAWGISEVLAKWRYRKIWLGVSAGLLFAILLICTRIQVRHWQNSLTLYKHTLAVTENNFFMHDNYGCLLLEEGRLEEAARQFKESLRIYPKNVKALNNIGSVLLRQGKFDEAIKKWENVLEIRPDNPDAHFNIGLFIAQQGKYDEAIEHFNEALRAKPDWPEIYNNLGTIHYRQGRLDLAFKQFTEAIRLKADFLRARINLASILLELGKVKPAVEQYYQILELKPQAIYVLNDLAWILATTENREIYNPTNAVELAQKACEFTNYEQPKLLDTLAVAYAAAGNFGEAVETAEKALNNLALSSNQQQLADEIKNHLELYKRGQPHRKPSPAEDNASR